MRRFVHALMLALFLPGAVLAGISKPPIGANNPVPVPYNQYWTAIGDSRIVEESTLYGPGGFLDMWTGGRTQYNLVQMGIGGQTETQVAAWPRESNPNPQAAGHLDNGVSTGVAGNVLTITTQQSNPIILNALVYVSSIYYGKIIGNAATSSTCGPSACTGTGGTGTYLIDTSTGTFPASSTVDFWNTDTNTIADAAAANVGIVEWLAGTNSAGADISAPLKAIKGLTVPGWPYPGYRPNGESTDQPLPLWPCTAATTATCRGKPKVVLVYDELRRGCDMFGTVANVQTSIYNLRKYAKQLLALDYRQQGGWPNVVVADTWDMDGYGDPAQNVNLSPLCGLHVDGLHLAPTLAYRTGKAMADALWPSIYQFSPIPRVLTTDTYSTSDLNTFTPNPMLSVGTSGTNASGVGTNTGTTGTTFNGTPPAGVALRCTSSSYCGSATFTNTTTALGANLGNEYCVRAQIPSASTTAGNFTIWQVVPSSRYSTVVSTDKLHYAWKDRWSITSGYLYNIRPSVLYNTSFTTLAVPWDGGEYSSGAHNALYKATAASNLPWADTSHATPMLRYGAETWPSLTAPTITQQVKFSWWAGEALDFTYCISQWGLLRY